ncbi:nucleotide exchange factor GrpE [Paenibacillus sp. JX-17]|uniref:Protein GrpE n=1 Tax=Paenibacillus lacisoli TaxID=3064525 RepID=A0ABT9C8A2_9BACL|nr:nucleotide exchange factor GrpE [Paenibacillus sp. JX-17]MDO7905481.1 nucleotide exchange factor GrpE [Paenibacillus sp. JX-17]
MKEDQTFQGEEQQPTAEEEVVEVETTQGDEPAVEEVVNESASLETESAEENDEAARLRAEAEESQQRFLRTQADFDNFRRRTAKEKEDLAKYASMKLINELVPVIDNFERAVAALPQTPESESFTKGIHMIFRQFEGVLQAEGLTAMETVGEPFNPEFHQAIMQVESDEYEEGIVVEEVQKGYMLKDKVLRPAMVKVSM